MGLSGDGSSAGCQQQDERGAGPAGGRGPPPGSREGSTQQAGGGDSSSAAAATSHARSASPPPGARCVVGLALKKEKRKKHISDRLVAAAEAEGITLQFIDKELPLEAQGPFVAILQKVRKPEWERELVEYAARFPHVRVFDLPAKTYLLRNRGSMVSFLDGDGWLFQEPPALVEPGRTPQRCRCNVPTNTTLQAGASYSAAARQMAAAGLRYPLLAKPLWADGREGSHALAVVHTPRGLRQLLAGEAQHLQPPIMLQQYVDHGGCLFKVYVLGDTSVRVKRNSLHLLPWSWSPPAPAAGAAAPAPAAAEAAAAATAAAQQQAQEQQAQQEQQHSQQPQGLGQQGEAQRGAGPAEPAAAAAQAGEAEKAEAALLAAHQAAALAAAAAAGLGGSLPDLELMARVSAYPGGKSWGKADTAPKGHGVPSPPAWLLQALAQRLRHQTGLSLFNFDVIVPMERHRRQQQAQAQGQGQQQGQQCQPLGHRHASSYDVNAGAASAAAAAAACRSAAARLQLNGGGGAASWQGAADRAAQAQGDAEVEEPAALDLRAAAEAAAAAAAAASAEPRGAAPQQALPDVPRASQQAAQQAQQEELLFHLIDINYFPGYEKMPDYERYMLQFLRSICFPEQQQQGQTQ